MAWLKPIFWIGSINLMMLSYLFFRLIVGQLIFLNWTVELVKGFWYLFNSPNSSIKWNLYFLTKQYFVVLFRPLKVVKSYKSYNITRIWTYTKIYSSSEQMTFRQRKRGLSKLTFSTLPLFSKKTHIGDAHICKENTQRFPTFRNVLWCNLRREVEVSRWVGKDRKW